ncbi:winged helix-turn-helix domain-containing protein [Micromonospora sp. NPDC003197]
MSVSAISSHRSPSARSARATRIRRGHDAPSTPSVLTVSFDVLLAGEASDEPAARLLDLLRELVDRGEGRVTVSTDVRSGKTVPGSAMAFPLADVAIDSDAIRILSASRLVLRGGRAVPLTRLEFDLLLFLAEHPRRVFTRLQLLNNVWGYDHAVARTVDVHVRRLRAKMGEDTPLVTTVYGVGYRLADDVRVSIDPEG